MIYANAEAAYAQSGDCGPLGSMLCLTMSHGERDNKRPRKTSLLDLPEVLRSESIDAKSRSFRLEFARYERSTETQFSEAPAAIHAIEVAYHGESVTPEYEAGLLAEYNIAGLIVASRSHEDRYNDWCMFLPLSKEHPPHERPSLLARVESFLWGKVGKMRCTLSSSVKLAGLSNPAELRTWFVDGRALDRCDDVDAGIRYPDGSDFEGCLALAAQNPSAHQEAQSLATSLITKAQQRIAAATPGTRKETLAREAYALGVLAAFRLLTVDDIVDILIETACESGYCDEYGGYEIRRTIRITAAAGWSHPKPLQIGEGRDTQLHDTIDPRI